MVTRNCATTPYKDFEHTKGRDNILADSLSGLKTLGFYKVSDPGEPGSKYDKSILTQNQKLYVMSILSNTVTGNLKLQVLNTLISEKDLDDLPTQSTELSRDLIPSSFKCNLHMTSVTQLKQQDTHFSEIATKCK